MAQDDSGEDLPFWAWTRDGSVPFSDYPVRPGGRIPTLFIVGAAKSATTSLNDYLDRHPDIFMAPIKEPHFFSTDPIYERGLDWYKGLFANARPDQICGEASTSYTRYPHTPDVPARIAAVSPDARIIYIVRDPVDRLISESLFALKRERYVLQLDELTKSVDEHLEKYDVLRDTSEYIVQIEQYLRFFDRSQILVLLQSDLGADPDGTLAKAFEFIGVPNVAIDATKRSNESRHFMQGMKDEAASKIAHRIPGYRLVKRVVPDALVQKVKSIVASRITHDDVIEPLSEGYEARLRKHYARFNDRLGELIGRDLSSWN